MHTKKTYDAIVLGVGGMGSSTCYHLAKKGLKVAGIEQFSIAHNRGSSHGDTRTIRLAYYEHEEYVPILKRAYALWENLCQESGRSLLHRGGIINYGPHERGRGVLEGTLKSAAIHGIPIEKLTREEALKLYPGYIPPENYYAVYEPSGGYLEVENCVQAYTDLAKVQGADIFTNTRVLKWEASPTTVTVTTDQDTFEGNKLIITAGAWSAQLLKDLNLPLKVHRTVLLWLESQGRFHKENIPSFTFDMPYGFFYGLPSIPGTGFKLAEHKAGEEIQDPLTVDRKLYSTDSDPIFRFAKDSLPFLSRQINKHAVCMYVMTPDCDFIVDRHPQHSNVVFAAGFSGHGFKFASVMGEILTELSINGQSTQLIDLFKLSRFKK